MLISFKRLNLRLLPILLIILFSNCGGPSGKELDGKIITYKVEYLEDKAGAIPTSILPRTMKVVIADHYAMNTIEGFFGQFSLTYIAHLRKETVTTVLKLFDKKYFYRGKPGEIPCGLDPMNGMELKKGETTKEIAGVSCQEYIVSLPGKPEFSIFSSPDIGVHKANITTPYRSQDHFLLEFYVKLAVLQMNLTATDYREEKVPGSLFLVPEGYQEIERELMLKYINELFRE
jgi:hypothetical protein